MRLKILLADDHVVMRQALRHLLESDGEFECVAECSSGSEAVEAAQHQKPDIAIIDITMPGMSGIDATPMILKQSPQTAVLILTMHQDERYVLRAMKAGALGYVLKNSAGEELVEAIRAGHKRHTFFSPAVAEFAKDGLGRASRVVNANDDSQR
ncbi:MAG: response regulator transcription factor [Acidobacteriia bacterium]|nr:response regulator transcription factor [Terriglobia bacterium]